MPVYTDASASVDDRVSDLLSRMTIQEKAAQLVQGDTMANWINTTTGEFNASGLAWNMKYRASHFYVGYPTTRFPRPLDSGLDHQQACLDALRHHLLGHCPHRCLQVVPRRGLEADGVAQMRVLPPNDHHVARVARRLPDGLLRGGEHVPEHRRGDRLGEADLLEAHPPDKLTRQRALQRGKQALVRGREVAHGGCRNGLGAEGCGGSGPGSAGNHVSCFLVAAAAIAAMARGVNLYGGGYEAILRQLQNEAQGGAVIGPAKEGKEDMMAFVGNGERRRFDLLDVAAKRERAQRVPEPRAVHRLGYTAEAVVNEDSRVANTSRLLKHGVHELQVNWRLESITSVDREGQQLVLDHVSVLAPGHERKVGREVRCLAHEGLRVRILGHDGDPAGHGEVVELRKGPESADDRVTQREGLLALCDLHD